MADPREADTRAAREHIREVFRDAGVRGWLHAAPVDGHTPRLRDREVDLDADAPVVMASVYKLVVLVAWCRAVEQGHLDPREPVHCAPQRRTVGPTGLSLLVDPAVLSLRDLVTLMITVSDNAAGDLVLERVGLAAVHRVLDDAGLVNTHIRGGTAQTHRELVDDTRADDVAAAFRVMADYAAATPLRALEPTSSSATTPRDMTRLLGALGRGELLSAESTRWALRLLAAQIWPHRLRAGFPAAVTIAGKTGSLGPLRNEVGLVTYPGEHPVAVAVFTHAARPDAWTPRADAAIGTAARIAVGLLRSGGVTDPTPARPVRA